MNPNIDLSDASIALAVLDKERIKMEESVNEALMAKISWEKEMSRRIQLRDALEASMRRIHEEASLDIPSSNVRTLFRRTKHG